MHKFMAALTKPSNAVQTPSRFTRAPPSLKSKPMDAAGNKMMSRQSGSRALAKFTNFAFFDFIKVVADDGNEISLQVFLFADHRIIF